MKIHFEDQKLSNFTVYTKPEAQFIPPHELTESLKTLDGFSWREDERPELYDVAYYLNPEYDPENDSTYHPAKKKVMEKIDEPQTRKTTPTIQRLNNPGKSKGEGLPDKKTRKMDGINAMKRDDSE